MIKIEHLTKEFRDITIFHDFAMEVNKGEFIAIVGESGVGKSTLLNLIGLLDTPNKGNIIINEAVNIKPFSTKARHMLRDHIGYLFQNFALIEHESVFYNLEISCPSGKKKEKKEKIKEVLGRVGLSGFEHKRVYKCSGGEQQRIAVARLMLKSCDIILADEPTGSLDDKNKKIIFSLLLELKKEGKTIVVATHDKELAELADRTIVIQRYQKNV